MKKTFILLIVGWLVNITAAAQWNTDTSVNNLITPTQEECYNFEIRTNDNGITYAFMEIPINGIIVKKLQILDKDGYKIFDDDCKVISNENTFSFTVLGRHILIDDKGDALIVVNDQRTGEYGHTLYKFDENGNEIWGNVQLNDGKALYLAFNNTICQTSDGGYVIAYLSNDKSYDNADSYVQIEKVDRDGKIVWKPIRIGYGEDEEQCIYPYVMDAGDGRCMVIYAEGSEINLKARLLDTDGNAVWKEDVVVYDYGAWGMMPLHIMMNVYEGPDNGVLIAWQDLRDGGSYRNSLSYITKDGAYGFPTGSEGTTVSNDDGYSRRYPKVFYDDKERAFFCFYRQYDQYYQDYCGLFMQKISYEGERLWGDNGKAVIDIQNEDKYDYCSIRNIDDDRFAVFYQKAVGYKALSTVYSYIIIYDKDGNQLTEPVNFSTSETTKSELYISEIIDGRYFIASWSEDRRTKEPDDKTPKNAAYVQRIDCEAIHTGINDINTDEYKESLKKDIFSIDGKKQNTLIKGVNLIRYINNDGTIETKKVLR